MINDKDYTYAVQKTNPNANPGYPYSTHSKYTKKKQMYSIMVE